MHKLAKSTYTVFQAWREERSEALAVKCSQNKDHFTYHLVMVCARYSTDVNLIDKNPSAIIRKLLHSILQFSLLLYNN